MINTKKLKSRIAELGLTEQAIAQKMDISTNTLRMQLEGQAPLYADDAFRLAEILGVNDNMVPYFFAPEC